MMPPHSNGPWSADSSLLHLRGDGIEVVPPLRPGEVHVWSVLLDQPEEPAGALHDLLCGEEQRRAARFRFELDRNRFMVGRGSLRMILGYYGGTDPAELSFTAGPHGKPGLAPESGRQLFFNLSHARGLAVCAVACDHEVGIDVEFMRTFPEADAIAARWFSASEQAELRSLPPALQAHGFFRVWTSKEAYLKATGEGIAEALNRIEVRANPTQPPALLRIEGQAGRAASWSLHELAPASGCVITLAEAAQPSRIFCGQWTRHYKTRPVIILSR